MLFGFFLLNIDTIGVIVILIFLCIVVLVISIAIFESTISIILSFLLWSFFIVNHFFLRTSFCTTCVNFLIHVTKALFLFVYPVFKRAQNVFSFVSLLLPTGWYFWSCNTSCESHFCLFLLNLRRWILNFLKEYMSLYWNKSESLLVFVIDHKRII
jgi:hypothetical protein